MNKIIGFDNEFNSLLDNFNNNNLSNSLLISGNKGIGKCYFLFNLNSARLGDLKITGKYRSLEM